MKLRKYIRNKYAVACAIFVVYTLFLDDVDIFTIVHQNRKLNKLNTQKELTLEQLQQTKQTLQDLNTIDGIERYARERKFFKTDNEDIFVISYE